eukprot:5158555-Prymnesium_polylepis.1
MERKHPLSICLEEGWATPVVAALGGGEKRARMQPQAEVARHWAHEALEVLVEVIPRAAARCERDGVAADDAARDDAPKHSTVEYAGTVANAGW